MHLNAYLIQSITTARYHNFRAAVFLDVLHKTGLRASELDYSRWALLSSGFYSVQLAKSVSYRFIHADSLPLEFQEYLNRTGAFNWTFNYHTLRTAFLNSIDNRLLCEIGMHNALHLFRYNYVLKHYNEGFSIEQIKQLICHNSVNVTNLYLNNGRHFDNLISRLVNETK